MARLVSECSASPALTAEGSWIFPEPTTAERAASLLRTGMRNSGNGSNHRFGTVLREPPPTRTRLGCTSAVQPPVFDRASLVSLGPKLRQVFLCQMV